MEEIMKKINIIYRWLLPKKTNILIFSREGSDEIAKYVLRDISDYAIYDHDNLSIFFNIFFISKYIKNIFNTNLKDVSLLKSLYLIYIKTEIQFIKPKIIITYNDDNYIYHNLINIIDNIEFIAIQNGLREKFIRKRIKYKINHNHLFCFGYDDQNKNLSDNWKVKNLYASGSLRAGVAISKFKSLHKRYDICLISEYEPRKRNDPDNHIWNDHWLRVTEIISTILKKKNYRVIIALNGGYDYKEQVDYFNSIFKSQIEFTNLDKELDSYRAIIESDITIGFCSTLLVEAMALRSKTLQINTHSDNTYFNFIPILLPIS